MNTDFIPAYTIIQAPDATPEKTVFILHGILGSERNWRSFAIRLAKQHPKWRFVLVDHRNHGESGAVDSPHTLDAIADDLARLAASLDCYPTAVWGHSYGGKVALAYVQRHPEFIEQVWSLDCPPGAREQHPLDHKVMQVLAAINTVKIPVRGRNEVKQHMLDAGFDASLAGWICTNLVQHDDGFHWRFHLAAIEDMLTEYFATDLWDMVEVPPYGLDVHIVRAERSDRWTSDDLDRLDSVEAHVHILADAGHWLHMDNAAGLMALMSPSL